MQGCAEGAAASDRSVWSEGEVRFLSDAQKRIASVKEKMNGHITNIQQSLFLWAKYSYLAELKFSKANPLTPEIQELIVLKDKKVEELNLILQHLISSNETKANQIRLKGMLQEGGEKPDPKVAFVRYALYQALQRFGSKNIEALRDPGRNEAILGLFVDKNQPIESPIRPEKVEHQLAKVNALQSALEKVLISDGVLLSARICRAHDLFLSHLERLVSVAVISSAEPPHDSPERIQSWIVAQMLQAMTTEDELGEDMKRLFSQKEPKEVRFEAARKIINGPFASHLPIQIRLKAWQVLAENDPRYEGLFKSNALRIAGAISRFDSDRAIQFLQCLNSLK